MTGDHRFTRRLDQFIADHRAAGRLNSPSAERSYRSMLMKLAEDVGNRDPRTVGREDVKRCLRRWPNPNSQRVARSIFVAFFDWAMEEGIRSDNPARQTRRPKKRPTAVYEITRSEAGAMLNAASGTRERRAIFLGLCAGLRNAELRGLRGEHFRRDGFIWVSADIAKGGRERWVPVMPELEPIVAEIRKNVGLDHYVLPAQRWRDAPFNQKQMDLKQRPSSSQALRTLVMTVAKRAGIAAHVHPHLMRHFFGQYIARQTDIRNAQFTMGHASIATTQIYTGRPTLDDLSRAFATLEAVLPPLATAGIAEHATMRIEPVESTSRGVDGFADYLARAFEAQADKIRLYQEHFGAL